MKEQVRASLATPHGKFIWGLTTFVLLGLLTVVSASVVTRETRLLSRAANPPGDCSNTAIILNDCDRNNAGVAVDQVRECGDTFCFNASVKVCNRGQAQVERVRIFPYTFSPYNPDVEKIKQGPTDILASSGRLYAGDCVTLRPGVSLKTEGGIAEKYRNGELGTLHIPIYASAGGGTDQKSGPVDLIIEPGNFQCGDGEKQTGEACDPEDAETKTKCENNRLLLNCKSDCSGYESPSQGLCTAECGDPESSVPPWDSRCNGVRVGEYGEGVNSCQAAGQWCDETCNCAGGGGGGGGTTFAISLSPTSAGPGDPVEITGSNIPEDAAGTPYPVGTVSFDPSAAGLANVNWPTTETAWDSSSQISVDIPAADTACPSGYSGHVAGNVEVALTSGDQAAAAFTLECPETAAFRVAVTPASVSPGESISVSGENVPSGQAAVFEVAGGDTVLVSQTVTSWDGTPTSLAIPASACSDLGASGGVDLRVTVTVGDAAAADSVRLRCGGFTLLNIEPDRQVPENDVIITAENVPAPLDSTTVTFTPVGAASGTEWPNPSWNAAGDQLTVTIPADACGEGETDIDGHIEVTVTPTSGDAVSDAIAFTLVCAPGGGPAEPEEIKGVIEVDNGLHATLKEVRIYYQEDVGGAPTEEMAVSMGNTTLDVNQGYTIQSLAPGREYKRRAELDFIRPGETEVTTWCDPGGESCDGDWYDPVPTGTTDAGLNFNLPSQVGRVAGVVTVNNRGRRLVEGVEVEVRDADIQPVTDAIDVIDVEDTTDRWVRVPYEIPVNLDPGNYTIQARVDIDLGQVVWRYDPADGGFDPIQVLTDGETTKNFDVLVEERNDQIVIEAKVIDPAAYYERVELYHWREGKEERPETPSRTTENDDWVRRQSLDGVTTSYSTSLDKSADAMLEDDYRLELVVTYWDSQYLEHTEKKDIIATWDAANDKWEPSAWEPSITITPVAGNNVISVKTTVVNNATGYIDSVALDIQEQEADSDWSDYDHIYTWSDLPHDNDPDEFWTVAWYNTLVPDKEYRVLARALGKDSESGEPFEIARAASPSFTTADLPFTYGDDEPGFVFDLASVNGFAASADINADGAVSVLDYSYLVTRAGCWTPSFDPLADVNGNGTCNVADVDAFVIAWTILSHY
jgi:hypothetical protein